MGFLGIDVSSIVKTTIQSSLQDVAEELNCSYKELFIKIVAKDENFEPEFHIYHTMPYEDITKSPSQRFVRLITLKEILGG
jgi:hypothetical protein